MFSAAQPGAAQDFQQIFLPSVVGGIYAPRAAGEERLFRLLDCVAAHPMLDDGPGFGLKIDALRAYLATLDGLAYSADLNEWFHLCGHHEDGEDPMDKFISDCAARWEQAEHAIASGDFGTLERLFEFDARNAANSLGFQCWMGAAAGWSHRATRMPPIFHAPWPWSCATA